MNEVDFPGRPTANDADAPTDLSNGLFGAEANASTAAVAEFRKHENVVLDDGNSVERTYLGATPAVTTSGFIYLWYRDLDRLFVVKIRFKKYMGIRPLDVTIEELNPFLPIQREREVDGNGGLPRTPLTARNRDDHIIYRPLQSVMVAIRPVVFMRVLAKALARFQRAVEVTPYRLVH